MQRTTWSLTLLLIAALSAPAAASTFIAMNEAELVAAADAIVRGTVVSTESFWNERHTLVITEAVFEVESVIVGKAPRYVTLRTAGGTVEDLTVEAIGFPVFHEGERALLFLQSDDVKPLGRVHVGGRPPGFRVAGYQLGHYRIVRDRQRQEIAVPTADPGMRMLRFDGRAAERPRARRLASWEVELREIGRHVGRPTHEQ